MKRLTVHRSPSDHASVYDHTWRERLQRFYIERHENEYWAYSFDRMWQKFQRGVDQELELARMAGHWFDLQGARVLVIGSYLGAEAIAYSLCGARVTGIDLDETAMSIARDRARLHRAAVNFQMADAADTPFPDGMFDYVSCAQVLEHLPPKQQPKMLAEIWRLTRPGGCFWIDTPNQWALMDHHDSGLPMIHWLPRAMKIPLAKKLGRTFPFPEPAFGWEKPLLHYYMSWGGLQRELKQLGRFEILSHYRGYADVDHYAATRREQGRGDGVLFNVKVALMRGLMKLWNFNRYAGIRVMIRKESQAQTLSLRRAA